MVLSSSSCWLRISSLSLSASSRFCLSSDAAFDALEMVDNGFVNLFDECFAERAVDLFVFLLNRVECVDGAAYCDFVILVECVDGAV